MGGRALLRVSRIDDHRLGAAPVLAWLDWKRRSMPSDRRLARMPPRMGVRLPGVPVRPATFRVAVHRRKDPDWLERGFVRVAQLGPIGADPEAHAWSYLTWPALQDEIDRLLA